MDAAKSEGASVAVDGREHPVCSSSGFFLGTSLIDNLKPGMRCYDDEIFGPVLGVMRTRTYEEALDVINSNPYANGTAIFTRDGGAARQFQFDVEVGMVGINVPTFRCRLPITVSAAGKHRAVRRSSHVWTGRRAVLHTRQSGHQPLARSGHEQREPRFPASAVNVLRILRFFLPGENPIGFGLADGIEIFVVAIGVAAILLRCRIAAGGAWLADRPRLAMVVLSILPVGLRLSLLRQHPVPIPTVPDDFSFLLLGDTLAHFRLANPVHPMHRFFESLFILQEPSYSSIYPPGQGIALAVGQLLGHPWIGVLLSMGVFCGLCFWMLRAWVAPVWALCGGLLSVAMFGPLSRWTNDYFGGAVSAIAGCLASARCRV